MVIPSIKQIIYHTLQQTHFELEQCNHIEALITGIHFLAPRSLPDP